jgi:hypothetical protein
MFPHYGYAEPGNKKAATEAAALKGTFVTMDA